MKETNKPTIGCIIPTYMAKDHLRNCLMPLIHSPLKPRILVIDSSSNDETADLAGSLGAEVLVIPQTDFNHGSTREMARQKLGTDIVCFLTQDAYFLDEYMLERLVTPIIENQAKISYARQIPHKNASFFESFPRFYNYPEISQLRGIDDCCKYGVYTFFCSNSCAAYSNVALNEIGGFSKVLLGEDTVATAKILHKGHKIAYCSEAIVYHSHNYSIKEEFFRCFDTGLARKSYAYLIACGTSDEKHGVGYVKTMAKTLLKEAPWLLPYAFVQTFVKWAGYTIGAHSLNTPKWFKRILSSQKYFWNGS